VHDKFWDTIIVCECGYYALCTSTKFQAGILRNYGFPLYFFSEFWSLVLRKAHLSEFSFQSTALNSEQSIGLFPLYLTSFHTTDVEWQNSVKPTIHGPVLTADSAWSCDTMLAVNVGRHWRPTLCRRTLHCRPLMPAVKKLQPTRPKMWVGPITSRKFGDDVYFRRCNKDNLYRETLC